MLRKFVYKRGPDYSIVLQLNMNGELEPYDDDLPDDMPLNEIQELYEEAEQAIYKHLDEEKYS